MKKKDKTGVKLEIVCDKDSEIISNDISERVYDGNQNNTAFSQIGDGNVHNKVQRSKWKGASTILNYFSSFGSIFVPISWTNYDLRFLNYIPEMKI